MNSKIKILELLYSMKLLLAKSNFDTQIINVLSNSIVSINKFLEGLQVNLITKDELAEKLVLIIELYNSNPNNVVALDTEYNSLKIIFNEFCDEYKQQLKLTVLIHGIDVYAFSLGKALENYANVLGFIDSSKGNINKSLNEYDKPLIIDENLIHNYEFDFVLIVNKDPSAVVQRLGNKGVPINQLVDFFQCVDNYLIEYSRVYSMQYDRSKLYSAIEKVKRAKDYEVVITGLSYTLRGIGEEYLNKKSKKLSLPSQDLYYDYQIINSILKRENNIKYCIIGLSYYSFDWDLSLTKLESTRIVQVYNPIFNDTHNLEFGDIPKEDIGIKDVYKIVDKRLTFVLDNDFYVSYIEDILGINLSPEFHDDLWNSGGYLNGLSIKDIKETDRVRMGNERVSAHNKLNFPRTVEENKGILINYIKSLTKHNIKPILVVFPTTKYYSNNFSKETKNRFYSIVDELSRKYDFQLIDLFNSNEFDIVDFLDWDHLNKKGAIKMTKLLNKIIEW